MYRWPRLRLMDRSATQPGFFTDQDGCTVAIGVATPATCIWTTTQGGGTDSAAAGSENVTAKLAANWRACQRPHTPNAHPPHGTSSSSAAPRILHRRPLSTCSGAADLVHPSSGATGLAKRSVVGSVCASTSRPGGVSRAGGPAARASAIRRSARLARRPMRDPSCAAGRARRAVGRTAAAR